MFKELYYWDSYFIMLVGETANDSLIIENHWRHSSSDEADSGVFPRQSLLSFSRSQPPFLLP